MSYTPKHIASKNSTAGRKVAGLALAGAATVGAGVTQASTASADSVWDRLAQCESGGNWSINTGNSFYGGIQFTHQTWVGYGGQQFAPRADLASKAQQITIAQKVLADVGPRAWPVCSVRAGLTRANGAAGVTHAAPAAQPATQQVSRSAARTAPVAVKTPAVSTYASGDLVVDGIIGPRTTAKLQAWVGTYRDGILGPITKKALQAEVGTYRDGIIGPKTVAALQDKLGIQRDGATYLNARTVRALQAHLNNTL